MSATAITAAVVRASGGAFELEELELAGPRQGELLVRLAASGLCHADLLARDQHFPVPLPAVFGHEGAGVVEAVGDGPSSFTPGDPVLMSFTSCRACSACLTGRPAYCVDFFRYNFGSARPDGSSAYSRRGERVNGHFFGQSSFASHTVVREADVVRLPAGAPLDVLAPLGCAVQTGVGAVVNSLRIPAGAVVAIYGAGSVGLSAVMGARLVGAARIIVVDVNPARLTLARELGATEVVHAGGQDVVAAVRDAGGDGVEFALETSGRPHVVRQAVDGLAIGGVAGLIGVSTIASTIELAQTALVHGLTVRGILQGDSVPGVFLPRLVELYRQGRLPLERIVATMPLADIEAGSRAAERGEIVKPVFLMA